MALFKKLFGGESGQKKDLTAREGYTLALDALREACSTEADGAYLCCVYASVFDSDAPVEKDGTCRGWHFDFFLPTSRNLYLVRVKNGKARGKQMAWEKTQKSPIEYICAVYGKQIGEQLLPEPPRVPEGWLDSPAIISSIRQALEPHRDPEGRVELEPIAFCLPARHLRYLQEEKAKKALSFPPAPRDCFAVICSAEELYEEDCYLLYIGAATAEVVEKYAFRFPNLFSFGSSLNW